MLLDPVLFFVHFFLLVFHSSLLLFMWIYLCNLRLYIELKSKPQSSHFLLCDKSSSLFSATVSYVEISPFLNSRSLKSLVTSNSFGWILLIWTFPKYMFLIDSWHKLQTCISIIWIDRCLARLDEFSNSTSICYLGSTEEVSSTSFSLKPYSSSG